MSMGLLGRQKWLTILVLLATFALFFGPTVHAQKVVSTGMFTGFTVPITLDQGINQDPRYQARYDLKWLPIGFNIALDINDFGIQFSPNVATLGQNFYIANSVGGQVGLRRIKLVYLQLPVGAKVRLIDFSFLRISMVASVSPSLLLSGRETITHDAAKLTFPEAVEASLPEDYDVEYDGVAVPKLRDKVITDKSDYKPFQVFSALGVRADWDMVARSRLSFDLRTNVGILDPRSNQQIAMIKRNEAIYDIYGRRVDLFISFAIGFSKTLELDKRKRSKRKRTIYHKRRRR